jgi:hypothetical protein
MTNAEINSLKALIANLIDHTVGSVKDSNPDRIIKKVMNETGLSDTQASLAIKITNEVADFNLWNA